MGNLVKVLEDVQAKRKQLTEEVKAVLAEGISEFMKEHPAIKALGWTQYTPYFNDGDTCEFSVGEIYYSLTENQPDSFYDDEDDGEGSWNEIWTHEKKVPEGLTAQEYKDLVEFVKALNGAEEDLQAAFGDHVKVIVTQNGVDVEEYEHD